MKAIGRFLKELVSINGKLSSKRFSAFFVILPTIIITVFLKYPVEYVYALMSLFTALYGLTTVAKFSKNQ